MFLEILKNTDTTIELKSIIAIIIGIIIIGIVIGGVI
jgi:hypothetical protein